MEKNCDQCGQHHEGRLECVDPDEIIRRVNEKKAITDAHIKANTNRIALVNKDCVSPGEFRIQLEARLHELSVKSDDIRANTRSETLEKFFSIDVVANDPDRWIMELDDKIRSNRPVVVESSTAVPIDQIVFKGKIAPVENIPSRQIEMEYIANVFRDIGLSDVAAFLIQFAKTPHVLDAPLKLVMQWVALNLRTCPATLEEWLHKMTSDERAELDLRMNRGVR